MALGNYAYWAFNEAGKPASEIRCGKVSVAPYKTWLHIYVDGLTSLTSPMELHGGELICTPIRMEINLHGPQPGAYFLVQASDGNFLCGCAVYGYDDERWVGITPESKEYLLRVYGALEKVKKAFPNE